MAFFQRSVPVGEARLEAIVEPFAERIWAKNELLLEAGTVSNEYFFLSEGLVRAFTVDPEGNEVTTNFFGTNRAVFEVASFFLRIPSTETLQALTDCRGYALTYDKLNGLFHTIPEFREFGRAMLVREFAAFKQRTLGLINQTAEERYAALMQSNREIFQHAPLKHIASYLGVTDTSLSRIRREFARKP